MEITMQATPVVEAPQINCPCQHPGAECLNATSSLDHILDCYRDKSDEFRNIVKRDQEFLEQATRDGWSMFNDYFGHQSEIDRSIIEQEARNFGCYRCGRTIKKGNCLQERGCDMPKSNVTLNMLQLMRNLRLRSVNKKCGAWWTESKVSHLKQEPVNKAQQRIVVQEISDNLLACLCGARPVTRECINP
jgi:hypothetical protein